MESNIIEQLEDLKNQNFKLGNWSPIDKKVYTLNNFKVLESNIVLFTDKRTFNLLKSELPNFLNSILAYTEKPGFVAKTSEGDNLPEKPNESPSFSMVNFEPTETQKKTQQALSDLIDKVLAGDKDSIPKAKAVCEIANTMVNMEKSQTELLKLATKQNR